MHGRRAGCVSWVAIWLRPERPIERDPFGLAALSRTCVWIDTRSVEAPPVGYASIGFEQNNLAIGIGKADHQYLRHKLADLFWRKIHNCCNLLP